MIVKDEEENLTRCLESIHHLVDEIIIVDTGSTDKTKETAEKFTSKIFDFIWVDDFSKARNFSFNKASKDYIFWLDADDILLEEDHDKFALLKNELQDEIDAVSMPYLLAADENNTVSHSVRRNRVVKRSNHFKWHGAVHEYLEVGGNIKASDIRIKHCKEVSGLSNRNIKIYEKMLSEGKEFTPRDMYYYANECYDHNNLSTAIDYYNKFLDTNRGWEEDVIASYGKIADCYIHLNDYESAIDHILESFKIDIPRAEQCCRLGYIFLNRGAIEQAIYWYKQAAASDYERDKQKGGFINANCYTWLPHLQLCVCYDLLNDHKKAYYHNSLAKKYNPNELSILHNEKYLNTLLN
ncbi:glycosyltransferase [Halobacillus salinarum]|uniref:Glycosyltransferase n=1 Tax=Halobacillus salinarum TaxID=2932257 RepID=A0ABY4EGS2_9BACI|nr:glycosyltransferase [Halobacillus salinarum]UOQ43336.1 glycosyltransferase [Halobacillus salinarum]